MGVMLAWIMTGVVACGAVASERSQSMVSDRRADYACTEKRNTAQTEHASASPEADIKPTKKAKKQQQHPSLRIGSAFRLDLKATVQEDARASQAGTADFKTLELYKSRIGVSGNFYERVEYEVEGELTDIKLTGAQTRKSPWKDVYVNVNALKMAQLQAGKFKIPFGRDELTPAAQNDFVYRSLGARYLAPARDVGAMVHGRLFQRGLSYSVGVFAHDGEHARSSKMQGGDDTVAARVTVRPFRPIGSGPLELGAAVVVSSLSNESFQPNGLQGRTVITQDTFFDPVYVQGQRQRWEADADWTAGRVSARAELTWVNDDRLQQGIGGENLPDARARSWYISGSWMLNGEGKKRRPGMELVGRFERLWFDSVGANPDELLRNPRAESILPSGNHAVTVGVNWTLNRWVKLQVNGIHERVEDEKRSPVPEGSAFWSHVFRLQFAL